ncbi:MAG: phosphate acyltransferase [Candidatus Ratteibacteria bacterium]|nr:phosphate acyltransferase [Candidatus Ratteibacteria bacterium]
MSPLEIIYQKAREKKRTVVFPEANDDRIIRAVSDVAALSLARPVLLGQPDKILNQAEKIGVNLDLNKIEIVNTAGSDSNPLSFGAMLVSKGEGDAMVAGAVNTTADVFRVAFQIIGPAEKGMTVSSYFLMIIPDCPYGEEGAFLFADAGIVPEPSPSQLANIAIATADNIVSLLSYEPRVAMLSFSTKSSAEHRSVERVQKATQIVREKKPDLIVDGELQVDAAIVSEVAAKKAPDSPVGGKANVLIFPDLDAANISYKLVERLAKAEAYGPVFQGLNKPVSDLSRGCRIRDIINCSAIVAASA